MRPAAHGHDLKHDIKFSLAAKTAQAPVFVDYPSGGELALEILGYKSHGLSEEQIEELIRYVEFIQDRDDSRTDKKTFLGRHTREGSPPPDVLN